MKKQLISQAPMSKLIRLLKAAVGATPDLIDNLVQQIPTELYYYKLALSSFGTLGKVYLAYKQEELNEIVQLIKDNPEAFTKHITGTKAFKDGFITAFHQYLLLRSNRKKQIAQNIILKFAVSTKKEEFELERLNDILIKISVASLVVLFDYYAKARAYENQKLDEKAKSAIRYNIITNAKEDILEFKKKNRVDSVYVCLTIWIDACVKDKKKIREEIAEAIEELFTLGILRFDGLATYTFSRFGQKFVDFILN